MAGFGDLLKSVLSAVPGAAARVSAAYGNPSALNDEYTRTAMARQQGLDQLTKQEMQQKLDIGKKQLATMPSTPEEEGWMHAKPITNAEDSILREQSARTGQVRKVMEQAPVQAPETPAITNIAGVSSDMFPSKPVTGPYDVPTPIHVTTPLDVQQARANSAYLLRMLAGDQRENVVNLQQAGANKRSTERTESKEVEGGANRDVKKSEGQANRESKETLANQAEAGKKMRWVTPSGNTTAAQAGANARTAATNATRKEIADPYGEPQSSVLPPTVRGVPPSSTAPPTGPGVSMPPPTASPASQVNPPPTTPGGGTPTALVSPAQQTQGPPGESKRERAIRLTAQARAAGYPGKLPPKIQDYEVSEYMAKNNLHPLVKGQGELTPAGGAAMAQLEPVQSQAKVLMKRLEAYKDNNMPGYLMAPRALYALGRAPADDGLGKEIANLELERIAGAMPFAKASRAYHWIQDIKNHLPNVWTDSPKLLYDKLRTADENFTRMRGAIGKYMVKGARLAPGEVDETQTGGGDPDGLLQFMGNGGKK